MAIENVDIEELAWADFATVYPHECYAVWPERFWAWFHQQHPRVPRTEMERMLGETEKR